MKLTLVIAATIGIFSTTDAFVNPNTGETTSYDCTAGCSYGSSCWVSDNGSCGYGFIKDCSNMCCQTLTDYSDAFTDYCWATDLGQDACEDNDWPEHYYPNCDSKWNCHTFGYDNGDCPIPVKGVKLQVDPHAIYDFPPEFDCAQYNTYTGVNGASSRAYVLNHMTSDTAACEAAAEHCFVTCDGWCASRTQYNAYLGDSLCDDGVHFPGAPLVGPNGEVTAPNLNCEAFDFDMGDCSGNRRLRTKAWTSARDAKEFSKLFSSKQLQKEVEVYKKKMGYKEYIRYSVANYALSERRAVKEKLSKQGKQQ